MWKSADSLPRLKVVTRRTEPTQPMRLHHGEIPDEHGQTITIKSNTQKEPMSSRNLKRNGQKAQGGHRPRENEDADHGDPVVRRVLTIRRCFDNTKR